MGRGYSELNLALRSAELRTEQLVRLVVLGAPEIVIDKQREMVDEARERVSYFLEHAPD